MAAAAAGPSREALLRENAELEKKISALKAKLGVEDVEEAARRVAVRQMFDEFDSDKNGVIDREELEVLIFECGGKVSNLSEEALDALHARLSQGDGSINFEAFYKWIGENRDEGGPILDMARVRLHSKSMFKWLKDAHGGKAKKKDGDNKPAAKKQKVAAGNAARKLYNFQVGVGEVGKPAKASIEITGCDNKELAATVAEEVECPEEVKLFAHIDLGLHDDADDMKVGELCGMLEVLIDALPIQALSGPFDVYHSHSVDVHEDDEGNKALRLTIFSKIDLKALGQKFAGADDLGFDDAVRLRMSLELPWSLDDFHRDLDARMTPKRLAFLFTIAADVDSTLHERAEAAMANMPPVRAAQLRSKLAFVRAFLGCNLTAQFGDVADFLEQVPAGADFGNPAVKMRQAVHGMGQMPIGRVLTAQAANFAPLFASQRDLYNLVRSTITGLHRIHIQSNSGIFRLDIKGFDFVQFLPVLPEQ